MKKLSKGYIISAALLLVWAGSDIYHYAVIGGNVTSYYGGADIISKLVKSSLFHAIVKIILAIVVFMIGFLRARSKKAISSRSALSILVALSIFGTWFVSMVCLTLVTARGFFTDMTNMGENYATTATQTIIKDFYDENMSRYNYQYERPDFLENQLLTAIDIYSQKDFDTSDSFGSDGPVKDISYPIDTAVLVYDGSGNLIHSSAEDIIYFDYYTEDQWDKGMDTTAGLQYGYIDISDGKNADDYRDDLYGRFRVSYAGVHSLYDYTFRIEGFFKGTELIPVVMYYTKETEIHHIVESDNTFKTGESSYQYIISDVDKTGKLNWNLQFDRRDEFPDTELETVYITAPRMWDYGSSPIYYNGTEYDNLADMTAAIELPITEDYSYNHYCKYKLNDLLVFDRWVGSAFDSDEYNETGKYTVDFYLITAYHANPLACAVKSLLNVYIYTAFFAIILALTVIGIINRRLIEPVSEISSSMESGWIYLRRQENPQKLWREVEILKKEYESEKDLRRIKDNEITRLNTALDYAKTAEQNRRQMVSNIAHELKTPLAVIHSYAEGLKEHIAEDKRDKYIDVILSEAERTDSMVLEMLDLSRLEAGKVKLSRDEVSLEAVTRHIFDKLAVQLQDRGLTLEYDFPPLFTITVDESRICQVIENLASNAIKYTTNGGHIKVTLKQEGVKTTFAIENTSPPLSDESLSKVWESFYRADESRASPGTGLGLAIVKSIIELHGGKCFVRNTDTGVIFGFTV